MKYIFNRSSLKNLQETVREFNLQYPRALIYYKKFVITDRIFGYDGFMIYTISP